MRRCLCSIIRITWLRPEQDLNLFTKPLCPWTQWFRGCGKCSRLTACTLQSWTVWRLCLQVESSRLTVCTTLVGTVGHLRQENPVSSIQFQHVVQSCSKGGFKPQKTTLLLAPSASPARWVWSVTFISVRTCTQISCCQPARPLSKDWYGVFCSFRDEFQGSCFANEKVLGIIAWAKRFRCVPAKFHQRWSFSSLTQISVVFVLFEGSWPPRSYPQDICLKTTWTAMHWFPSFRCSSKRRYCSCRHWRGARNPRSKAQCKSITQSKMEQHNCLEDVMNSENKSFLRQYHLSGSEGPKGELQTDDAEARADFGSIQGEFIHRRHVEPRVHLYVPKEETFLIPPSTIDITRATHTDLDVVQE